jgi:uncharacterized pyridoxal phosphate-containing UPF0001 family protein
MSDDPELQSEIDELVGAVQQRIAAAAARVGRSPTDVELVGVSKFQPVTVVRAGLRAGLRHVGENDAVELCTRAEQLAAEAVTLHLLGPLAPDDVADRVARADVLHGVTDAALLADVVAARSGRSVAVYVQVDAAGAGAGVAMADTGRVVEQVRAVDGVDVRGLMTMPPEADETTKRRWFGALRSLAGDCGLAGLSMGTTDDFEVAVEEGATVVRVGRQVFGVRHGVAPPELRHMQEEWLARNPRRRDGVAGG